MKIILLCLAFFAQVTQALETGSPAPEFTAITSSGKTIHLSDYKGKIVVLEWLNYGCPFVKKHYDSSNMQNLQKEETAKNIVWLSVISSAPEKQGYSTAATAESDKKSHKSNATDIILDPKGDLGNLYQAKTTPHMFIIDATGNLAYQGGIDDKPSTDKEDIKGATNYVRNALQDLTSGKKVKVAQTKPYGCSVKY